MATPKLDLPEGFELEEPSAQATLELPDGFELEESKGPEVASSVIPEGFDLEETADYESAHQSRIAELQKQQEAAYAEEDRLAQQDADPNTWGSDRFKKEAPKPKTIEEQAIYDATLAKKKLQEEEIADRLLPEELQKPKPAFIESAKPVPFLRSLQSKVASAFDYTSPEKSSAIYQISEDTGIPIRDVRKHFDELSHNYAREAGIQTFPTTEEFLDAIMTGAIPLSASVFGPLEVAKGIMKFAAVKTAAETTLLPAAKAVFQKITNSPVKYEVTRLREFLPDNMQDLGTVSEFILYGMGAHKLGKFLADPRVAGELAAIRFRILRALGVKQPTALMPLTAEQITEGFGGNVAEAARHSTKVYQTELAKRSAGETKLKRPAQAGSSKQEKKAQIRVALKEEYPELYNEATAVQEVSKTKQPILDQVLRETSDAIKLKSKSIPVKDAEPIAGSILGTPKSIDSLVSKVIRKRGESPEYGVYTPKDHTRGSIILDDFSQAPKAIELIRSKLGNSEIEVTIEKPLNYFGYRGINITTKLGDKINGEIQVHTLASWKLKLITDDIYASWRDSKWNIDNYETAPPEIRKKFLSDIKKSKALWKSFWKNQDFNLRAAISSSVRGTASPNRPKVVSSRSTQVPSEVNTLASPPSAIGSISTTRPSPNLAKSITSPSRTNLRPKVEKVKPAGQTPKDELLFEIDKAIAKAPDRPIKATYQPGYNPPKEKPLGTVTFQAKGTRYKIENSKEALTELRNRIETGKGTYVDKHGKIKTFRPVVPKLTNELAEAEVAYGGEDQAKKSIDAISRREGEIAVNTPAGPRPVWQSPLAVKFKKTGTLFFPKQKVTNPADIAFAFQSLKNEAIENFFTGAIKKGTIVSVELLSLGGIDFASISPYETVSNLKNSGADEFFLVHNHPSGRVDFSREDLDLTTKIKNILDPLGIKFRGHVIINDIEFGFIDPAGAFNKFKHAQYAELKKVDVLRKYVEWSSPKSELTKVSQPDDIYEITKGIKTGDNEGLAFFLNKGNSITGAYVLPHRQFTVKNIAELAVTSRATGLITVNSFLSGSERERFKSYLSSVGIKFMDDLVKTEFGGYESRLEDRTLEPEEPYKRGVERGFVALPDVPKIDTEGLYQKYVNRFQSIENLSQKAKALGLKIKPGENPGIRARLYLGVGGKAQTILEDNTFRITPDGKIEVTGEGLKPILDDYSASNKDKKADDDLHDYLVARRIIEDLQRPKNDIDPENIASPKQVQDARAVMDELKKKYGDLNLFEKIAPRIYGFEKRVLHMLVDSNALSEDQFQAIVARNPNRVPFYRIFGEEERAGGTPVNRNAFSGARSFVKRIKGSEKEIHNVIENIIQDVYRTLDVSERNTVARSVAKMADMLPDKIEKARTPMMPVANVDDVTIFRPSTFKPKGPIIEYYEDGKKKYIKVTQNLYDAMTGMNEVSIGVLTRLLSIPAHWLRVGATITPEFMLRNPIRDQFTAFMQTKIGFKPFLDTFGAISDILGKKEIYYDWIRSGGAYSTFTELSRKNLQRMLRDLKGSHKLLRRLNIINSAQDLSQLFERATRLAVYKAAIKSGKSAVEAGFESREATVDFARRGSQTKDINAITAFFGAGVQGLDKSFRAFKDDPFGFTIKALAAITLPAVLLYLYNRDDEDYKEIPRWQRDLFWVFKVPWTDTYARIPKPFLYGQVFGSAVERLLEFLDSKDPKAFEGLVKSVVESATPVSTEDPVSGLLPTGIKPLIENEVNWSFFRGRELVPKSREMMLPSEQYHRYATETAKMVGKKFNLSPSKLENLMSGYFGGSGRYILDAGDIAIKTAKKMKGDVVPEKSVELSDIPLVKGFVTRSPYSSSESVNRFYENKEAVDRAYMSYKSFLREQKPEEARTLLKEKPGLRKFKIVNRIAKRMSELTKSIDKISNAAAMSDETKRNKTRILEKNKVILARRGNAVMNN